MWQTLLTRSPKTEYALLAASVVLAGSLFMSLHDVMGSFTCWQTLPMLWGLYRLWRFWTWRDLQTALNRPVISTISAQAIRQGDSQNIPLGQGFVWGVEQAQHLLDFQQARGELPYAGEAEGSYAFQAIGEHLARPVSLPTEVLRKHLLIEGRTGSGKSQLATLICRFLIAHAPGALVVIEPKDDPDLVGHLIAAAHEAGRKLAVFAPYAPALSCRLSPLSTCRDASEVRARLSALMPPSKEAFFSGRSLLALERTAAMQQAVGEAWDLGSLLRDATLLPRRLHLAARYLGSLGVSVDTADARHPPSPAALAAAYAASGASDELAEHVLADVSSDPEHYRRVTDNLNVALGDVVHTPWRHLLTDPQALSWREIDQDDMVLIVLTASLLTRDLGRKTATLIMQDFMGHMGRRITTDDDPERRPIYLVADEFGQMAYPDIADAVALVGSAGGRVIALWQSRAALADDMGDRAAQALVDNMQTRVTLALADDLAARRIAESMGTRQLLSAAESRRRDHESGFSGGRTLTRRPSQLVEPEWLMALPPGHGWVRLGGRHYKIAVPLLEPFDAHVVAQLGYGDLVETIRRQKEKERRERAAHHLSHRTDERAGVGKYAGGD